MALNRWGEPVPERLKGEQGEAWALILMNNEYFDGEDGIAYGAQQRLLREWRENKPATVKMFNYTTRKSAERSFATTRAAYRYAVRVAAHYEGMVHAEVRVS